MIEHTEFVVRAELDRHGGRWSARVLGRPPLDRIRAHGPTLDHAAGHLAQTLWALLPGLPMDVRDGVAMAELEAIRVQATTSRWVSAAAGTDTTSIIPGPRLPDQHCLTIPFDQVRAHGRVRVTVDPDAGPLGGLAAAGPTPPVAEAALVTLIRARLARPPLDRRGITTLRMLRTITLVFGAGTLARRSAS